METQTIVNESPRVGRNDACPCGSNKKHKFCCGAIELAPAVKPHKTLSPTGFNQCFMILLERAGGSADISCADLEKLVKEQGKAMSLKYKVETDSFHFEMLKVKISPIVQPGGKKIEVVEEEKKEEVDDDNSNSSL